MDSRFFTKLINPRSFGSETQSPFLGIFLKKRTLRLNTKKILFLLSAFKVLFKETSLDTNVHTSLQ